jgi:molybdenum cofactor cytidylyltransferase
VSKVVGVILAAGQSSRMGQPKALLRCPPTGHTFVTQLILALRSGGLEQVGVVGRPHDVRLRDEIAGAASAIDYVVNPSPELGQLSSLLAGVDYAETHRAAGALVVPVDMPLIRAATVRAALDAFTQQDEPVLRVTYRGQHGHPVIFGARVFPALRHADPAQGARAVIRQDPSLVRNLEVDDPGVLRDIDLPEEYRRLFDRDPG